MKGGKQITILLITKLEKIKDYRLLKSEAVRLRRPTKLRKNK